MPNRQTLNDLSEMPFGKFEGTLMQDVPTAYLHWYYTEVKPWNSEQIAVMDYIERSLSALKQENSDLIWIKKK